jgi:biopolymer transport protein ExbB
MEESMMEIVPQLEKRTQYLALLSNIATLFGLLGTIMGLIMAFSAVATASPASKAALLAASISEAMNCTAFGLMAAIPLLLLHARLTTTAGQIVNSLEMASVRALNSMSISMATLRVEAGAFGGNQQVSLGSPSWGSAVEMSLSGYRVSRVS